MYERHRKWRYSNNLDLFSPKMLPWELTEYSLPFKTSLEADFDLGGHQNEVGGLFLQNMFERHTNWRYPINLHHFGPKMRSPGVRDHAIRFGGRFLTSEVIKMRSEDILTKICSTGRPTEDILSICTILDQKWGHQVLGIMLWGDQTGPFKVISKKLTELWSFLGFKCFLYWTRGVPV